VGENDTWIVCKHVMDGTAEKVQVRRDKVCMCLACSEDPTILETEEIYILDESLLMERLKTISHVFDNEHNEKKTSGSLSIISHLDSSRTLTIFEAEGPLFFDEMVLAIKHFFEAKDNPPTNNILWDFRNATVDQSLSGNVEELAIFASEIDKRKGLIKTAIVASNDSVFDFAQLYKSYISKPSIKLEVFRAMDDANKWLQEKW
jgi:hypothetical protein